MPSPERPASGGVSRRSVLGWMVASAVTLPAGAIAATPGAASAEAPSAPPSTGTTIAPRAYFPTDVTKIPPTASLPDLFRFFSPLGSPNGHDRVTRASEWPARAAELSDLMQFYLFGFKHPTPENGSVFRQVPVPATTIVNFGAVFSFSTFSVNLPPGSFTLDFSSFTITPNLSFVATHAVVALVAPRPFILWTGEAQQSWLGSPSSVLSLQAGKEVYELLGAGGNIAWIVRDAQHANQDRDLPDLIAIMDRAFGRRQTVTRRHFDTLAGANGGALDGSGVIYPERTFASIADMTRNPYDIENFLVQWSRPGKHTLWSEDTFLTAGMARVLTFHTDAHQVQLTLPDGRRLMGAAPHGVATFSLTAAQAQTGRYVAETRSEGEDEDEREARDHRQIELAGFSLSDALRHGLNLTSGVPAGMAVGFSSALANWGPASDPVQLFVDGSQLTAATFDDGQHQGYIERFGASLKLQGAPAGPWDGTTVFQFSVKNIKLQALPGFTFAVDLRLAKTQVPNFFGQLVNGFSSTLGEKPSWSSQDLQNTPLSGNFHGRWPMFPNTVGDTGARPISIPSTTAFKATITVTDASATGLTLRFSEPLDPNEFGVGLEAVSSWTTQWAADSASVRIAFAAHEREELNVIVFRAVDTAGNMIGGPVRLAVRKHDEDR